jgi:asparagine synthase (glutamine-hydrolysing)
MCGIAGVVDRTGGDCRAVVERQLRTLDHRGPDAWGVFASVGAAIGQTRLAIIDLVTGDPPITNSDHTVGAVLNGEIYNFATLRTELTAHGHDLTTVGDTEVIAHLAEDHDPVSLARRLDGMFAFAVWDGGRRRLVVGRDRLGKKPLYYWAGSGLVVFGSEIKTVLTHPSVANRLDAGAIPAYLTFGYVPTPRTFYDGIVSLPPGHVLVVEQDGSHRVEPYWRPPVPDRFDHADMSLRVAAVQVRTRLKAAVERRMVSDVPLGAFLSGGVDSSTVVGLMAEISPQPVKTFTIGFDDQDGFDERPYAAAVAKRFATDHVEFVVQPDAIELVERLVWHHDQPFGDSSAIPTFLLSELTRKHVTVALCGDGGDELFAGYERFTAGVMLDRWGGVLKPIRKPLVEVASRFHNGVLAARAERAARLLRRTALGLPDAFMAWVSFTPPEWRTQLLGAADNWATQDFRHIWSETEGAATLDRLLNLTLRTYLLDDLLPKVDRMAMAHGLEVRSPFLDTDLVEYSVRLPPETKARHLSRKRVLKAAVADLLPAEILGRRKHGFGVPLDRWFRRDLAAYVDTILGPQARVRKYVTSAPLDAMLAEHRAGTASHGHFLWTMLTLEVFLRRQQW